MNSDFTPHRGQTPRNTPPNKPTQKNVNDWQHPLAFQTPEEVAQSEGHDQKEKEAGAEDFSVPNNAPGQAPRLQKKSFGQRLKSLSKKQWALIIIVVLIILGGAGFAVYKLWLKEKPKPVVEKQQTVQKTETPKTTEPIVSTLTGLPISDASINSRPVTAVMIENSPDARPQSGLLQAGVVFEAVAEGGITRFLTLFQDSEPDYIGPVRSVRPYYIHWLEGFDAAVAHVGGSAEALKMLKDGEAKDLDQFSNPGPYHRISSRFAPHNMYSSVVALRELQQKKGYTSNYTGFLRKAEAKSAAPNPTSIDFNISGAIYNPHYDYDPATNTYKRSEGGKPHVDEKTGQQLAPKVVIALTMVQGSNGIYTTYGDIGSGQAYVFQDGALTIGTWTKNSPKDQVTFKDSSGAPIKLDPGQTWISAVGSSSRISYR